MKDSTREVLADIGKTAATVAGIVIGLAAGVFIIIMSILLTLRLAVWMGLVPR